MSLLNITFIVRRAYSQTESIYSREHRDVIWHAATKLFVDVMRFAI